MLYSEDAPNPALDIGDIPPMAQFPFALPSILPLEHLSRRDYLN